ncbi:MAG: hypothetical protein OXJ64_06945, partial [Boseongicola sp.]|nr:hypothetical protein [Boseongicola sp.]
MALSSAKLTGQYPDAIWVAFGSCGAKQDIPFLFSLPAFFSCFLMFTRHGRASVFKRRRRSPHG